MTFVRLKKLVSFALLLPALAASAESITGVVTNRTNNKPASGDDVVLIRLAQGMQESTRTKTDAKGRFTLDVPDPQAIHLVRVTHDKANYFRPAPPGTQSVEIDVFNAAAKVKGVSMEARILRVQTDEDGKALRIVENFFVKNESKPQMTQFSERPIEFTLPEGAVVEGSAALAPGGMPVQAQPVPLPEKGHYTFLFPIRPGQTRFQVSYHVPYSGNLTFKNSIMEDTGTLVVIMAKSMKFDAGSIDFKPVTDEVDAQTYVARDVKGGGPLGVSISGTGQLPRQTQTDGPTQAGDTGQGPSAQGSDAASGGPPAGAANDNRPGGGLGNPVGTPDPLTKYKWWIIGSLAILLAVGAGVMLRTPAKPVSEYAPAVAQTYSAPSSSTMLQTVLRDELFSLEADRVSGRISEQEYATLRPAFDLVFKRAMERQKPTGKSNV